MSVVSGPPTQAVILAGGRGVRMRPLTDTRPKPMIAFHGKPFLEYLIDLLREQGIKRILLLLGYLPEVIQEYFGDGRRWGVDIEYSVSPADDLTVRRVQLARAQIEPRFLLMYCDNYWPMRMDLMWSRFMRMDVPAMVTVYTNRDRYSRDSVRVDDQGYVAVYDRSRTSPGLQGIEIGFAILTQSVLDLLPAEDALFEEAVYPALTARHQLAAYLTDHRYYGVGSLERLPLTEQFLARRPAIILDRDGVLNRRPPRAAYVRHAEDFEWLPGAKESLRLLHEAGYRVIVVSNQAGVARGMMTDADVVAIHERMKAEAAEGGGRIDAVYYCPHAWDADCLCRKPRPGMLFQAQRDFHLDLTRTVFIGDDPRDAEAAAAAECRSVLVGDGDSLRDVVPQLIHEHVRSEQGIGAA